MHSRDHRLRRDDFATPIVAGVACLLLSFAAQGSPCARSAGRRHHDPSWRPQVCEPGDSGRLSPDSLRNLWDIPVPAPSSKGEET